MRCWSAPAAAMRPWPPDPLIRPRRLPIPLGDPRFPQRERIRRWRRPPGTCRSGPTAGVPPTRSSRPSSSAAWPAPRAGAARDGVREYMAGAMILVVLAVVMLVAGQSATVAVLIPAALFAAGARLPGVQGQARAGRALAGPGPDGRPRPSSPPATSCTPAPGSAGMAEHVAYIPESQLRAAADMCAHLPGLGRRPCCSSPARSPPSFRTPSTPLTAEDVQHRSRDLVRVGLPVIKDFTAKYRPPLPSPRIKRAKRKRSKQTYGGRRVPASPRDRRRWSRLCRDRRAELPGPADPRCEAGSKPSARRSPATRATW